MAIVLISEVGGDLRLLPASLEYYKSLGIDSILITLHVRRRDSIEENWVHRTVASFDGVLASIWCDPTLNHVRRFQERNRAIAQYCSDSDWIVNADIDEFHEYPLPLPEMVRECERSQFAYVKGTIVDRIAANGSLPELNPKDLWQQFPLRTRITKNILGANDQKVALSRAFVRTSPGHHCVHPEDEEFKHSWRSVNVHHFKWDSDVVPRLRARIEDLRRECRNWYSESQAFLDYLDANGGSIPVNDPRLEIF